MNKQLNEINSIYLKIQDYIDPTIDYISSLNEDDWSEMQKNKESYGESYSIALEKLRLLLPKLSSKEIAEGCSSGCRLLQRNLSGYMAEHFHQEYIPSMIGAVKQPHLHTAWLFLQALANNIGKDITPLAVESLDIDGLTETALSVIDQLNIIEALPKVLHLTKSDNETIAFLANQISKHLQSQI